MTPPRATGRESLFSDALLFDTMPLNPPAFHHKELLDRGARRLPLQGEGTRANRSENSGFCGREQRLAQEVNEEAESKDGHGLDGKKA